MKKLTVYESADGNRFNTEEDCLAYEKFADLVDETELMFGVRPDDINFTNGDGYIRHTEDGYIAYRVKILGLVFAHISTHKWVQQAIDDPEMNISYVNRLVSDGHGAGTDKITHSLLRLMCIGPNRREWGQPFYALNPDQGKNVCLGAGA